MKNFKLMIAIGLAASFSADAWASSYQYEVGAGFQNQDLGADVTKSVFTSAGAFYFEPIESGRGPYGEAGFISRQSNVSVGLSAGSYDDTLRDSEQQTQFGLDYQIPETKFGVQVGLRSQDTELLQAQGNVEAQRFEIGGSYYLVDDIRVSVALGREELTPSTSGTPFSDAETDSTNITVKGLTALKNDHYIAWQISTESAETVRDDSPTPLEQTKLGLAGSYFLDRSLSVGGGFTVANSDDAVGDGQQLEFTVEKYFTPTVALGFNFANFEPSQDGLENTVQADFRLGLRF